jgi:hypothetical protein
MSMDISRLAQVVRTQIVARILWDRDGEEWIETEALGWTGREMYLRMSDPR